MSDSEGEQRDQNLLNIRKKGHYQTDKETNTPPEGLEKDQKTVQGDTSTGHYGVVDGNRRR